MTALINSMTSGLLDSPVMNTTLNISVILVFLGLLLIREFIRSTGDSRADGWIKVLNAAIFPLLVVFLMVIVLRFRLIFEIHVLGVL